MRPSSPARTAGTATALFVVLLSAPGAAAGQDARVGISAGGVRSTFDGPPTAIFDDRTGFLAGVFADVAPPLRPLRLRVEGRWVRRGGELAEGGGAEMDLLSIPLAVGLRLARGPLAVQPSVGFEVAYPLAARTSPDVDAGFGESARVETTAFGGMELQVDLGPRLRLGVEGRRLRGLSAAFEGPAGRLESRATEFILRLSRPLR